MQTRNDLVFDKVNSDHSVSIRDTSNSCRRLPSIGSIFSQ